MTDTTNTGAPAAPEAPIVAFEKPAGTPSEMRTRAAAQLLSSLRKPKAAPVTTETREIAAPVTQSTAQAEDAAPPLEAPGETQDAEPAEVPPIEPPRSWTKDEKERFQSLPRETQEYLATREQERDRETRRSQNEAADKLKGLTAKEQAVEQARKQYEEALPAVLQHLQAAIAGEFSDIKTMADVERMQSEDFVRFSRWQVQQMKIAGFKSEVDQAQQRQTIEKQTKLSEFINREVQLFEEKAPEIKDKAVKDKLMSASVEVLKDLGFPDDELGQLWRGEKEISIHDHRLHLLIRDGVKWRDAQQKAKVAVAKPVPPAQRPGVSQGKGAQVQTQVQNLANKLENAKGVNAARIAAEMLRMKRRQSA